MDDDTTLQAMHHLRELEQEWLADEAAQAEYLSWLASLTHDTNRTRPCHAPEK